MQADMMATTQTAGKVRAKFFKDGTQDYVEISAIGDPCNVIHKVRPEHVQRFPQDWAAFEAGKSEPDVVGTPLTEVPGIDKNASLGLRLKGIRTVEELAILDEAAAKSLGMGGLTWWQTAKLLMAAREREALQAVISDRPRKTRNAEPQPEA